MTISEDVLAYATANGVDLSTAKFPYGYSGGTRTLEQIDGQTQIRLLNPEFRRRMYAAMIYAFVHGVAYGPGGGARGFDQQLAEAMRRHSSSTNYGLGSRWYNGVRYYLRPGFAPYAFPGSSNHEEGATPTGAIAADMVMPNALAWANDNAVPLMGLFDFRNIGSEPWHIQPKEWPARRADVRRIVDNGGRLSVHPLPGVESAPSAPAGPVWTDVAPTPKTDDKEPTMIEVKATVAMIREGDRGTDAGRVQALMNALSGSDLDVDGFFGPVSTQRLRDIQRFIGAKVDGICGPVMWGVLLDG